MEFDMAALRGIFWALSADDRKRTYDLFAAKGGQSFVVSSPERAMALQQALIELGHLVPFDVSGMDLAAQEYDDIMQAQELL